MPGAGPDHSSTQSPGIGAAIIDAGKAGLLALGLAVPILALRTETNLENQLVLQERWSYVAIAVAVAFFGRLFYLMLPARQPTTPRRTLPFDGFRIARLFTIVGTAVLIVYPFLVLAIVGKAASLKWIDNFGIQILIYVMLGWGLNIVVWLSGLLDL